MSSIRDARTEWVKEIFHFPCYFYLSKAKNHIQFQQIILKAITVQSIVIDEIVFVYVET